MKRGSYTIENMLHDGSSKVYRGRDERGMAAIKLGHIDRLQLEARILQELDHPHIIRLMGTDFGLDPCITIECGQRTLRETMPCDWDTAEEYMRQVMTGLAYAHSKGIIHADIKPENIIIVDGQAKIADWDLSRIESTADLAKELQAYKKENLGTPGYLSPEQAAKEELTTKTDIYSSGIMWYEMMMARLPDNKYIPDLEGTPKYISKTIRSMIQTFPQRRPTAAQVLQKIESQH